jgi:hypothetical protein
VAVAEVTQRLADKAPTNQINLQKRLKGLFIRFD